MARKDVLEWVSQFSKCATPEKVDAVFMKLNDMDEGGRREAVDIVEKMFVAQFGVLAPTLTQGVAMSKELVETLQDKALMKIFNEKMTPRLDIVNIRIGLFQCQAQTAWNILQIKEDEAAPVVQAIVRRTSSLSDEEYNSIGGVLRVVFGTLAEINKDKGGGDGPAFRRFDPRP